MSTSAAYEREKKAAEQIAGARKNIHAELSKVIIGQSEVIDELLLALLAGGHCLITGAPGLAKTLLIKSMAQLFSLKFQRIQFTPDLMPADITGTEILKDTGGSRQMTFIPGPIFANIILADEINRTPPKTQAALLEAMQEHQVTATGIRHALPEPFFVLATQNPIEMEGTSPLPEAQLDRFMLNSFIDYLSEDDEVSMVMRTTTNAVSELKPLFTAEEVLGFHRVVRQVPIAADIARYAVRIAAASRPGRTSAPALINDYVSWGAGPRAAQCLALGAKARALLDGRAHVAPEDIRALARPVLRHRILLNYRAEAEGLAIDDVIKKLVASIPESI